MNDLIYLFAALAVLWGGVMIFIARLAVMTRSLEDRLGRLEETACPMEKEYE